MTIASPFATSPRARYRRVSRHQSDQALDPTRASHDDQKAREAAQAAGLKGFKIVTESGGRKHYEWTGAGKKGEVDVRSSEREMRSGESAAEREASRQQAYANQLRTAQDNFYQAQVALAAGAEERVDIEVEQLQAAKVQRDIAIDAQVAAKKLQPAEAENLKALNADTLSLQESPSHAQRIVKQALQRKQYARHFAAPFDITAWRYNIGDVVPFTFAPLSFKRKLFRIVEMDPRSNPCPVVLREEHAAIYQWDADDRAAVQAAEPIVYDWAKNPLILAIDDAGRSAEWSGIADDDGNKPEDGATNSADPNSPFGPGGATVGDALDRFLAIDQAIENVRDALDGSNEGAVQAALDARDAARTAADNSAVARDQSHAARDAAQAAQGQALTSATAAAGSAGTAREQAVIASTGANQAGQQANIAVAEAAVAMTAAGEASISARQAATSKAGADSSAQSAEASSTVAASSAAASQRLLDAQFPPAFDPVGRASYVIQAPGAGAPVYNDGADPSVGWFAGITWARFTRIFPKGTLPKTVGRRYRATAYVFSDNANARLFIGWCDGPVTADLPTSNRYLGQATPAAGAVTQSTTKTAWVKLSTEITVTNDFQAKFAPVYGADATDGGPLGRIYWAGLTIEDITSEAAAGQSATAAATSAASAAASENAAGQSASAAETSGVAARTAASEATGYRDQAATSARNAAGSQATASAQAELASQSAGAAQGYAGAASTSAQTASTKADQAGQSASAAATAEQRALGFSGSAQTSASAAQASAAAADGHAASAAQSAALNASYSGGGNLLKNDAFDYTPAMDGWATYNAVEQGVDGPDASWIIPGGPRSMWVRRAGTGDFGVYTTVDPSIKAGAFYEASADVAAQRTDAGITIQWFRRDGAFISESHGGLRQVGGGGRALGPQTDSAYASWGGRPSGYTRLAVRDQAPPEAFFARPVIRGGGIANLANPYLWVTQPMLAEVANKSGPALPYAPSGRGKLAGAADSAAKALSETVVLAGKSGALAERADRVEARAGSLEADAGITKQAVTDIKTGLAGARLSLVAMSPGGRAQVTIQSDNSNGAMIDLVGNVGIAGNLTVDGTIQARKFNRASMSSEATVIWTGSMTPDVGQTLSVPWSLTLGQIPPMGRFIYEYFATVTSNAGTRTTTTLNGRAAYTDFVDDGGLSIRAIDHQGNVYVPRANSSSAVVATTDFVPSWTATTFAGQVRGAIGAAATSQAQFDALVSFAYNCGIGNLKSSTLLRLHKAGDYAGARAQFARWNKAAGKVLAGLTRRRAAEAALYASAPRG